MTRPPSTLPRTLPSTLPRTVSGRCSRRTAVAAGLLIAIGVLGVLGVLAVAHSTGAAASPYVRCRNGVPLEVVEYVTYSQPACFEVGPGSTVSTAPGPRVATGQLPVTGADPTQLLALGGVLVLLGAAAAWSSRRRATDGAGAREPDAGSADG